MCKIEKEIKTKYIHIKRKLFWHFRKRNCGRNSNSFRNGNYVCCSRKTETRRA